MSATRRKHDLAKWLDMLFELAESLSKNEQKYRKVAEEQEYVSDEERALMLNIAGLEKSIEGVAALYSKYWNIGAAKKILRALPRELCDIIYKELALSYTPNPESNHDSTVHYREKYPLHKVGRFQVFRPQPIENFPHYFDKAYMGSDFVHGMSIMLYTARTFSLTHPNDLASFLNHDLFGTNCVPLKHVKRISIDISLGCFNPAFGQGRRWSSTKFRKPLKRHYARAVDNLVVTKIVPWKPGAKLSLLGNCQRPSSRAKSEEILFPEVYDLKDRGWDVDVRDSYNWYFDANAAYFDYSAPRSVWEEKARADSAFASEDVRDAT